MNAREQEFSVKLNALFESYQGNHCSTSIRSMKSAYTLEELSKIWKKYFLESFDKIFPDSSFIKEYQDIIEQYGILYNKDNEEGLTYNYCDTNKIDFEKHGLIYLRKAPDCRIYDYGIFKADNCYNLKIFSNVAGTITGKDSTLVAHHRSRFEAIDCEGIELTDESYGIIRNVEHVIAHRNAVVNIYESSIPMVVDAYDNSIILGGNENVTIKRHSEGVIVSERVS